MIFRNPYFFLLLIPAALVFFYAWNSSEKRIFNIKFSKKLPESSSLKSRLFETVPFYMRVLAVLLTVIALARPQKVLKTAMPPEAGVDIIMAIDTSLSMAAMDFQPKNRIEAAIETAADFVNKRQNDRIGLVVFGGAAVLSCPLTLDYPTLTEFIKSITLGMTKADGTAVGDAIATAVNHLKDSKAKSKVIILLTDGRSNTGIIQDPEEAAKLAKEFGIKIYTVGVAKKGKAIVPTGDPAQPYMSIEDDLNEPSLMEIAKTTGGEFYRATNYTELQQIYSRINELEKTKFDRKNYVNYSDIYNKFLLPAIGLIFLVILLEKTFFMTIP